MRKSCLSERIEPAAFELPAHCLTIVAIFNEALLSCLPAGIEPEAFGLNCSRAIDR